MTQILLAEDDVDIVQLLKLNFDASSYNLTVSKNGSDALQKALANNFHLILLDIMLPGIDGIEVCKKIRERNITTPVIMLTSRSEEIDKVLALELGADDYITKPFSIRELVARVKAVLRRSESKPGIRNVSINEIQINDLYINKEKMKASLKNKRLDLTAKEFELLYLLASNRGKTFSRQELLEMIWGYSFSGYEHTVTSHINRLRMKIEPDLEQPSYILTTWGVGYRFTE
ncbi:MAG TPA: response regulator transcription factor [Parafilimonas sp.]|nr:response regulator transcription factor [Parafilimonas sp.]